MAHTRYKNKAGKVVPSVTTIISNNLGFNKTMLINWYCREFDAGRDPRVATEEACKTGTLTHQLIEAYVLGNDEFEPEGEVSALDIMAATEGLKSYMKWVEDNNVVHIESELKMVSEVMGVGGCCDSIAEVNGELCLMDYKTSKSVYLENIVQLAAYREMIAETTDYAIESCYIIHIKKNAEAGDTDLVHAYKIDNGMIDYGLSVFKTLLSLHKFNKDGSKYIRNLLKET